MNFCCLKRLSYNSKMKYIQKLNFKIHKIKKSQKSNIMRKLDMKEQRLKQQIVVRSCEDYIAELEAEYEARNHIPRFLPKRTKEEFLYNGSFHEAIGRVLLIAECFAIMPVRGITATHTTSLSFSWTNLRTIYCMLLMFFLLADLGLTMNIVFHGSITFNSIEPVIFRCCILSFCFSALNLARKWPTLMLYWHEIEKDLPQYMTQMEKSRMAYSIRMVMFVGMILSLAEHLLSMISAINYSNFCHKTDDPIKNFLIMASDELFYVFSYTSLLGIGGKMMNIYSTFMWNYMDIFVMVISIGLASTFRQLNDNLLKFKGMHMTVSFWSERRLQYRNICMLCDKMDNAISLITMISFSNNLYFICVQLLRSLNKMPSVAHGVYFYYSLIYLIGRTLAVSLYAATVHDESRRPLRYLRCVPKESWCPETKRFAEEICNDIVALSGMKFFYLTRKLVLTVAGTIVTYELVLIQFHEETNVWDCKHKFSA